MDQGAGQAMGTVTVLRDISELKKVEHIKSEFVNMVAHELRAPLSAVSGYLAIMRQGLVTDPAKRTEMLDRSEMRIKALLDLVDDLLNVSRMEAGTVRREISCQSIPDIVADVVELMGPLASEKQVTLANAVPPDLPTVDADREEIVRLFNNLLSNGIKYNKPGGSVTVYAEPAGPYVRIRVADTGIGISAEGVKRLFTEFFREKRPETAYVTGTGLGLSIVKRVVEFYHGRIEAASQLGEGTTFTVWLPCRYEACPTIAPPVV
jgi:signal transduction histidine kinase